MKKIALKTLARSYKNNGQHAEQVARFTLTGKVVKADNLPFFASGDIGNLQVKSSGATVCHGYNLDAHLDADAATEYGYVINSYDTMYIMSPVEYKAFVKEFGYNTTDSETHEPKIRLKKETAYMREWLEVKMNGRNYGMGRYWLG